MAFPASPVDAQAHTENGIAYAYHLASKSWRRTAAAVTVVVDLLTSTSTTDALSANQGKVLKDLIDGMGDPKYAADVTARNALTGLDVGDYVVVGDDDGAGNWSEYQITAITDGAWSTSTKILLSTKLSYERANSTVLPTQLATLPATGTVGQDVYAEDVGRWFKWTNISGGAWLDISG